MAFHSSASLLRPILQDCYAGFIESLAADEQRHAITAYNLLRDPRIAQTRILDIETWLATQLSGATSIVLTQSDIEEFLYGGKPPLENEQRLIMLREGIQKLFSGYRWKRIHSPELLITRQATYLNALVNDENLNAFKGPLHPCFELSTVIILREGLIKTLYAGKPDIPKILEWVDTAHSYLTPARARKPTLSQWDATCSWLESLDSRSPDLRLLLERLNENRCATRWATCWSELNDYLDLHRNGKNESAQAWCDAVGVDYVERLPVMLFVYPVPSGERLVRPTQLESGWNPLHFPSPESAVAGHPMDLFSLPTSTSAQVLPEWVHLPGSLDPEHFKCCRITTGSSQDTTILPYLRRSHWQRLEAKYGRLELESMMPPAAGFASS